jgi:hypothetical protein
MLSHFLQQQLALALIAVRSLGLCTKLGVHLIIARDARIALFQIVESARRSQSHGYAA